MKKMLVTSLVLGTLLIAGNVMAATSATWYTPAEGIYTVGTAVTLTGAAGASGGTGLDLALVLDASGSMRYNGGEAAQATAANALIDSLPMNGTSVAIVEFATNGYVTESLTSNVVDLHAAINGITATGSSTHIERGIGVAANELTGANHTSGRQQVMVVMSDGGTTASLVETAANNAVITMGVDNIHSVAMGNGANPASLQAAVNGVDNIYGNADDYGIYSSASMAALTNLLTGGGLVGVRSVDITDGSGTAIPFTMSGLGDISLDWTIGLGQNIFNMHVIGTDDSSADARWVLTGVDGVNPVPEPSTIILLGGGLLGLAWSRRKKTDK